jgi:phage shock protein A
LYEKAKEAMVSGNEDHARKLLLERTSVQEKLKKTLKLCAEEKKRLEQMQGNILALEERGREIERLLSRAVGAKAVQNTNNIGLSLSMGDPLLQKFRDAGLG